MKPVYKRILLKLSGEGLMGDKSFGMSADVIKGLAEQIKAVHDCGVEVCIVVGGGNIFRGAKEASKGMNRTVADHVGMLATVMNALYIQNALEEIGTSARVLSGLNIPEVCEHYIYRRALRHLEKGRVVIFAAGTGNPYFTTDTGAALRASEMQCDVILKATQVDGVYDSDPKTNPRAKKFEAVSFDEVITRQLKVMDTAAVALARENNIPIVVFSQHAPDSLAPGRFRQGELYHNQKRGINMSDFNTIKNDTKTRMEKTIETLKGDFGSLRAGRAHVSLLDGIMVEAYGSPTPLAQVGTISVPDARTLSVSVWDRGLAKAVEKAIMESDLGLNPASDGQLIRIPIPPLSEERRKELTKIAGKYAEQNKVAIRNIRRDALDEIKKLKKDNSISEDDEKRFENEVQKLTDDSIKKIEELLVQKEKDIMQV